MTFDEWWESHANEFDWDEDGRVKLVAQEAWNASPRLRLPTQDDIAFVIDEAYTERDPRLNSGRAASAVLALLGSFVCKHGRWDRHWFGPLDQAREPGVEYVDNMCNGPFDTPYAPPKMS